MSKQTVTLTFGDHAENHRGMQKIGQGVESGLTLEKLREVKEKFEEEGYSTELIRLNFLAEEVQKETPAFLLVVKRGVNMFVDSLQLLEEQNGLEKDTKAYMYGRVVNKKARHNLCFSDFSQKADFENKKGTVYDFKDLPELSKLRSGLENLIDGKRLQCEGNYYYDVKKTYIGFHGDTERKLVIGVRLGEEFGLYYQWYHMGKTVGRLFEYKLEHGDIYFMSDKAVGYDWRRRTCYTLRHAAARDSKLII